MDNVTQELIVQALRLVQEANDILNGIVTGSAATKRTIFEIEKYTSGSGNTTWKADCEDGTRVYFRQAQKSYYEELGCWEWLNELDENSVVGVQIDIETIPDGDFHKIVKVGTWMYV